MNEVTRIFTIQATMVTRVTEDVLDRGLADKQGAIRMLREDLGAYFNADDVQVQIQDFVMEGKG